MCALYLSLMHTLQVVEHKQQVLLEEKRKRAMDLHLDYIVDQTTKYSKWLVKGLATGTTPTPTEPSLQSAASSSLDGIRYYTYRA